MEITGVDFVALPTQDLVRADAFYGDVLGLERSIRWGEMPAREYETGTVTLAIMQSEAFGQAFAPHAGAPFAFHVGDVDAARAELEAAGVAFEGETIDSGVCRMAPFADPDGNALMLHGRYVPRPA